MADKKNKPKKKRWWSYVHDAYTISKRTYSWTIWALLGAFAVGVGIGVIFAVRSRLWWLWLIFSLFFGFSLAMLVLVQLVKRASYAQIDGVPGAVGAVLSNIKRGWIISEEPVRFNVRTQDMVFRAIGRPGVVLISQGPSSRVNKLLNDERKAIKRVAPSAPVEVVKVGNESGQVPISKLERHIRRMKKNLSNEEVTAVAARMRAIPTNALPIPKGVDPMKARPDRRGLRGK